VISSTISFTRAHALQQERHDGIEIAPDLRPVLHDRRLQVLDDGRHDGLELFGRPHRRNQLARRRHRVGSGRLRERGTGAEQEYRQARDQRP
jgi:hypothetical protein